MEKPPANFPAPAADAVIAVKSLFSSAVTERLPAALPVAVLPKDVFSAKLSVFPLMIFTSREPPTAFPSSSLAIENAPVYEWIVPASSALIDIALSAETAASFTRALTVLSMRFRLICPATDVPLDVPLPLAAIFVIVSAFFAATESASSMTSPLSFFFFVPTSDNVAPSTYASFVLVIALYMKLPAIAFPFSSVVSAATVPDPAKIRLSLPELTRSASAVIEVAPLAALITCARAVS